MRVRTKKWQNYANSNSLVFSALNDAETVEQPWLRVNRFTGTDIFSKQQQALIDAQQKQIDELRKVVVRLQRRARARRTHR